MTDVMSRLLPLSRTDGGRGGMDFAPKGKTTKTP
jgi:hypothetical protein